MRKALFLVVALLSLWTGQTYGLPVGITVFFVLSAIVNLIRLSLASLKVREYRS